jgi:copper chaperone
MKTQEFKIEGMSCGHCVMAVKAELGELNLDNAEVEIGKVKVDYDESNVSEQDIVSAIEEAGYKVV